MKRYYDVVIDFAIDTESDSYQMSFTSDWKFTEILDFMCDTLNIDSNHIVEIRHTYVKRYKFTKDASCSL